MDAGGRDQTAAVVPTPPDAGTLAHGVTRPAPVRGVFAPAKVLGASRALALAPALLALRVLVHADHPSIGGVQEFLGLVLIPEVQQDETARRLLSRRPISHVILTHRIGSIGTSLSDIGPQ